MDWSEFLRTVIGGMLGTVGFAIIFKSAKSRVFCCAVGGAIACAIYYFCSTSFDNTFFENLIPAFFATAYAEIMARIMKAPATPILACSIIALVPGGMLYYTTYYLVVEDEIKFNLYLGETLKTAAGLAVGIILVSVVINEINRHKFRKLYEDKNN